MFSNVLLVVLMLLKFKNHRQEKIYTHNKSFRVISVLHICKIVCLHFVRYRLAVKNKMINC